MSETTVANAVTYSQTIRSLIDEMGAAIEAVSRNALPDFEQSLWQQEMACATLKRLLWRRERISDRQAALTLRKELEVLKAMARSYERVVDRARTSTSLLIDLCSLHTPVSDSRRTSIYWEA